MRQWECGSVCPCAPIRFFFFLLNPGACRGTYAARSNYQPAFRAREGRALHAATSPFTGIRQCAPMAKELTAERRLPQGLKQPLPWGIGNGARLSWRRKRFKQAPGKPDQTRSIPRKGYICRASLRETGGRDRREIHGL